MTEKHNALQSVAAIKITYTDGRPEKIIKFGSMAELMDGECRAWNDGVLNVERVEVDSGNWKSIGEAVKGVINKCSTMKK